MSHRSQAGHAIGTVVMLLILVSGVGAWNYHRNWQIEKSTEGNRPYRSYAVDDLEALHAAYAAELESERAKFDRAKRSRVRPRRDVGSISENVEQFKQTARASAALRDVAAGVADHQGQIAELEREIQMRTQFGQGLMRHVKRLTAI